MGRPYAFPEPRNRSIKAPSEHCTFAKVVGLYNQAHGTDRVRYSDAIGQWFIDEAIKWQWKRPIMGSEGFTLVADLKLIAEQVTASAGSNVTLFTPRSRRSS